MDRSLKTIYVTPSYHLYKDAESAAAAWRKGVDFVIQNPGAYQGTPVRVCDLPEETESVRIYYSQFLPENFDPGLAWVEGGKDYDEPPPTRTILDVFEIRQAVYEYLRKKHPDLKLTDVEVWGDKRGVVAAAKTS